MNQEHALEVVSEYHDPYDELWQSFEHQGVIGEESFKNRLEILENADDLSEKDDVNFRAFCMLPAERTKAWLDIENIQEGKYFCVSSKNLKKYINPYTAVEMLQKGVVPHEEYLVLSGLLPMFFKGSKQLKLVFCKDGTFVTRKR
jgi:hypothetical protein